MAQILPPLALSAVEYETSPTLDPSPTSFPYSERSNSIHGLSCGASITTPQEQEATGNANILENRGQNSNIERPRFAAKESDTEIADSSDSKMSKPKRQSQSTLDRTRLEYPARETSGERDMMNSSDDEGTPGLRRAQIQPAGNVLSKSQLSKVRTHEPRPHHLKVENEFFSSQGRVARDGRLNISVNETAQTGYLAKALGATIQYQLGPYYDQDIRAAEKSKDDFRRNKNKLVVPGLNIVIMVLVSLVPQIIISVSKLLAIAIFFSNETANPLSKL